MTQLVLDRAHLIGMLSMDDFYQKVPTFAYLYPAVKDLKKWAADNGRCLCKEEDREMFRGLIAAFYAKMKELIAENSTELEAIRQWIANKKGSSPGTLVIYYQDKKSGSTKKLIF